MPGQHAVPALQLLAELQCFGRQKTGIYMNNGYVAAALRHMLESKGGVKTGAGKGKQPLAEYFSRPLNALHGAAALQQPVSAVYVNLRSSVHNSCG